MTGIDNTKTNGYAFIGDFPNVNAEHVLRVGSVVVEACDNIYTAYKIKDNYEKEKIDEQRRGSLFPLIQSVAAALKDKNGRTE